MKVIDYFFNRTQQDEVAKLQLLLEKPGTGVMLFNAQFVISKANTSAIKLFRQHQQIIEKAMPNFNMQQLLGSSLDDFSAIPDHVFSDLRKQHKNWSNIILLGEDKFKVSLLPLVNKRSIFKGGVFELSCITDQFKQEEEADRSKSILHHMVTPVMTCDINRRISSLNPALLTVLNRNRTQLQKVFAGFDPEKLIGVCIDIFHRNPEMQKRIFADPAKMPHKASIQVLDMTFNLTVFPVLDKQGSINGYAVEWLDCSAEAIANAEIKRVAKAAIDGQLKERINTTEFSGATLEFGNSVNQLLDAIIHPLNVAADYVDRIAKGDTPPKITDTYSGDFNIIKNNLNLAIDAINQQAASAQSIADGDLSIEINIRSDNDILAKSLAGVINVQQSLQKELQRLIDAAKAGQLSDRGKPEQFKGAYSNVINGINAMLDAIILPMNEAVSVLIEMEKGDLTRTVNGNYQGQLEDFKDTVNNTITKLSQVINDVNGAASNIASASEQVSATAQSMSQATSEQAASVEETSASVEQMSASVNQNTENAKVTDGMAAQASNEAVQGGEAVKKTVSAMKSIAGKIGIIDDIAYQTNLLALNAAIEAARAGEHGKGFAVVAAEVRKLAERSQVAAQEIGELATSSVEMAESAGKLLDTIVPSIKKTSDLVQEIAAASEEQSAGVEQINTAMDQLNQITQQNASSSEQLAATSEEMSGQAMQLQDLIGFFTVYDNTGGASVGIKPKPLKTTTKKMGGTKQALNETEFVKF